VRVISNRSSGKQGYAIAEEAAARGAEVTLVTTVDRPVPPGVVAVSVATAAEMEEAIVPRQRDLDVIVMAAAVADFRPKAASLEKIKKDEGVPEILLEPTIDILATLGQTKPPGQVLVGFAAETANLREHALGKIRRKNLDLIVANDVSAPGVGFEHDTNAVILLRADGREQDVPLSDKRDVARALLDTVVAIRTTDQQGPTTP
jgi:phosphopantothenoylcysteine decarboxylase/phosphopantothenate--cysteine ligase